MRARWHDWIIVLSIIALTVTGVTALWGEDVLGLFAPRGVQGEARPTSPSIAPPAGPAVGPL
jgi:hypothetical protein